MIKRVLVALDGSDHANKALDLACEMASRFGAELLAVHVITDQPLSDAERRMAVEVQAEGAKDFNVAPLMGASSDTRLRASGLSNRLSKPVDGSAGLWESASRVMPVHAPGKRPFRPFVRSRERVIRQRRS